MTKASKSLGIKHLFIDVVEMFDHRHSTPAYSKGRMDMALGPVKNAFELIPIGHVLEGQMFNRSPGDDQAVKFFIAC